MSGTLTGGLRDRMLHESMLQALKAELQAKGWLDSGRQHGPIKVIDEYPGDTDEVDLNTLAVSVGDSFQASLELGSKAETHLTAVYVDFYAEGDAVGRHVIGDLYAFVAANPRLPVYDYSLATPAVDFHVDVVPESAEKERVNRAVNTWQKHWYALAFQVEDVRTNA